MIEYIYSDWDGSDWRESWKEEYTYNSAYSVSDLVFPSDMLDWGFPINSMLTERKGSGWDEWEEDCIEEWTEVYYWSDGGVGVVETEDKASVQVYPNPTTGELTVFSSQLSEKGGAVEIYNVVGQCVGAYHIRPKNTETVIDISHLANGLYFLKVDGKTVKIVKQ